MHLKSVTVANFRTIAGLELRLTPGLNLVFGPNEAGKSTLLNALHAAFFVNADSTKAGRFRSWESQADPMVSVVFDAGGKEYLLEKTFLGAKKGRLACAATGLDTLNKDQITEELERLVPLYTSDGRSVRTTFWIAQRSLEDTAAAMKDDAHLRSALKQILFRADGDVEEIKKNLKKTLAEFRKGLERHADNPGPVALARRDMDRLTAEVAEGRAQLESLERNVEQQEELTARTAKLQASIEHDGDLLQAVERYRQASKTLEDANRNLDAIQEEIEAFQSAERRLEEGNLRAAALRREQEARDRTLASLKTAAGLEAARADLQRDSGLLTAVRDLDRKALECRRQLESSPPVAREELERVRSLARDAELKRESFKASQLTVTSAAVADVKLRVAEDGSKPHDEQLKKGSRKTFSADRRLSIIVPRMIEFQIASGGSASEELGNDCAAAERSLAAALERCGAGTPEALAERFEAQQKLAGSIALLETEKAAKLGGRLAGELEKAVEALTQRIADLEKGAGPASPGESVESAERMSRQVALDLARLETELRQLEEGRPRFIGKYGSLEQALRRKNELAREAVKAEVAIGEIPRMELDDEQVFSKKKLLEANRIEFARTRDDLLKISGALQAVSISSDQLRLKEGELSDAQALYASNLLEYEAHRLLDEALAESEAAVASHLVQPVEEHVRPMLARLTAGRYGEISMNERLEIENLGFGSLTVAPEELSTGTQGQIALALRLAFIEHLSAGERQMVVIDDALVNFDADRLAAGKKLLAEFAGRHQIIYLSCHPEMRSWKGAEVLDLGG